jgi:hypothetical protein
MEDALAMMELAAEVTAGLVAPADNVKAHLSATGGDERLLTWREEWGEIWMEARVVQGGNGLWTPWVHKARLGRPKKKGRGMVASTTLASEGHPQSQTKTRDEAVRWAQETWMRLRSEIGESPKPETL